MKASPKPKKTKVSLKREYTFIIKESHKDGTILLIEEIDKKYGFTKPCDIASTNGKDSITKLFASNESSLIEPINEARTTMKISELPEHIYHVQYTVKCMPETSVRCWWCKYPTFGKGRGCPIKYIPHRLKKDYKSEITKDRCEMYENIDNYTKNCIEKSNVSNTDNKPNIEPFDLYETTGNFCSDSCVMAYILKEMKNKNPIYYQSKSLLLLSRSSISAIKPAPDWELLRDFGGPLTIEEFRENVVLYDAIGTEIKARPQHTTYSAER